MVSSLEPCAMAMMFRFSAEIAPKTRPATPGVPVHSHAHYRQQSDVLVHFDGLEIAVRQLQRQIRFERRFIAAATSSLRTRKQKLWR